MNKIGLRNPGIDSLASKVSQGKVIAADKLLSIHGFTESDWWKLLDRCVEIKPLGIELNISCPNIGEISWPQELFTRSMQSGIPIVVKIPPVRFERIYEAASEAGVRWLHCCNTLPVPAGGMSGKPLLPISLRVVEEIRQRAERDGISSELRIIGGGGVTRPEDAMAYRAAGADVVAVGTKVFGPRYLSSSYTAQALAPIAAAAAAGIAREVSSTDARALSPKPAGS